MTFGQKLDLAKQEVGQKELKGVEKKKKQTIVKRCGFFTISWVIMWSVIAGSTWTYVGLNYKSLYESKTITIINPVEAKTIEDDKNKVEIEAVRVVSVAEIADTIWNNESTRGKHNYSKCEEIGKVNGIGYGIAGDGKYMCFESHEEEMKVLEGWITEKRARGKSDKELMCLYSGNNYEICK